MFVVCKNGYIYTSNIIYLEEYCFVIFSSYNIYHIVEMYLNIDMRERSRFKMPQISMANHCRMWALQSILFLLGLTKLVESQDKKHEANGIL